MTEQSSNQQRFSRRTMLKMTALAGLGLVAAQYEGPALETPKAIPAPAEKV